jgi:DNA-binding CsgD family transcriptional regulator
MSAVSGRPKALSTDSRAIQSWISIFRSALGEDGVEHMRADAERALGRMDRATPDAGSALLLLEVARTLAPDGSNAQAGPSRLPRLRLVAADSPGDREQLAELRARTDALAAVDAWAASLSNAELRLLPLLATHLTFKELASRLCLSRNTVKTQAISIYRKLGVSGRSEAIRRAAELGLVDRGLA